MRFIKPLVFLLLTCFVGTVSGQRYLSKVFAEVEVSGLTPYGFNYTVLPLATPGAHTLKQPLVMQMYTPKGDTEKNRPLVIYLHTGNFFPFPQNGSCGGNIGDSSTVEVATRLAKMGYVVAVADYRLGWNPFATEELVRRFTLINAAYRGVQDVRTCVRSFRKSVAVDNNPYGIDPNKIVVWGQGTGGYISMAAAYLNTYNEILTTGDPSKFLLPNPSNPAQPIPMVIQAYNGDVFGTTGPTIVDATYNAISQGAFPIGDTLCVPNHVGYSSNFNLAVNMGGALGDSSWVDAGETPLISFHVPTEFFAPCGTDVLNVPTLTGPQPVVEVSGSCDVAQIVKRFGLNSSFANIPAGSDPYGVIGAGLSGSTNGFYPFYNTKDNTGSPWEWAKAGSHAPSATCNYDAVLAKTYIDTVVGYFAPRACLALGLGCQFTDVNDVAKVETGLNASPNPASDRILLTADENFPILAVEMYDLNGRMVRNVRSLETTAYVLERGALPAGMYIAKVTFAEGIVAKKVRFQ